jgi:predicted alpha/beta-fold hydrolase
MYPAFEPIVANPHLLTILGNYWPRDFDFSRFSHRRRYIQTEPDVKIMVDSYDPLFKPRCEIVLVHGLEGSGESGYMISLSHAALNAGFAVHRFHMRTCGGTEELCQTLYHAGLTSDLISFVQQNRSRQPVFLAGFSLGGNVALKAAAEAEPGLIAGVATVAAAIDLAACSQRVGARENRMYQSRFVARMKARLERTGRYSKDLLDQCRTVYDIDDRITAPSFGFGNADRYYTEQSSLPLLARLRVPALLIAAKDDPLVPFASYRDPAITRNPNLQVIAPDHGGHIGFISRRKPRFWADRVILDWIESQLQ